MPFSPKYRDVISVSLNPRNLLNTIAKDEKGKQYGDLISDDEFTSLPHGIRSSPQRTLALINICCTNNGNLVTTPSRDRPFSHCVILVS